MWLMNTFGFGFTQFCFALNLIMRICLYKYMSVSDVSFFFSTCKRLSWMQWTLGCGLMDIWWGQTPQPWAVLLIPSRHVLDMVRLSHWLLGTVLARGSADDRTCRLAGEGRSCERPSQLSIFADLLKRVEAPPLASTAGARWVWYF